MMTRIRHFVSLILPFIMVVVLPYWLLSVNSAGDTRWQAGTGIFWLARDISVLFIAAGLTLFCWCVVLFARIGQGTLAPWDPTKKLVVSGLYRHMRNPMITAATTMITGITLFWGSAIIGFYMVIFVLVNHIYFIRSEEPGLEQRFGEAYRVYKANVPRWIPRVRPWLGE
jgi:protein-S-isoprenylcysteine O-methyltransferase Ste14